jgi:hypothetical protein
VKSGSNVSHFVYQKQVGGENQILHTITITVPCREGHLVLTKGSNFSLTFER